MFRPLVLLSLFAVTATHAQPFGGDMIIGGQFPDLQGTLLRVSPAGQISTILPKQADFFVGYRFDTDNKLVVVGVSDLFATTKSVVRVDPTTGAIVNTVWAPTQPGPFLNHLELDQNGDYLAPELFSGGILRLARDGSSLTTVIPAQPTVGYGDVIEDRTNGDYLVATFGPTADILRIDRNSLAVKATYTLPAPAAGITMQQDPHLPTVYAVGGMLWSLDPSTGAVATLSQGVNNVPLASVSVDRSPGTAGAMLQVGQANFTGGNALLSMDRAGNVLGTITVSPCLAVPPVTHDRGRNLALERVTAPNDRRLRVSFPAQAGNGYVVGFGLSGYTPGTTLADGRVIPLNIDTLTILTVATPPAPLITGTAGTLDANGAATASLNLNALGAAASGLRVWIAALTLDPAAPLGIGRISAPLLMVL